MTRPSCALALLVPLAWLACHCGGESPGPGPQPPAPPDPSPVVGTWEARGTHPDLDQITVHLHLKASGRLAVEVMMAGGGRLTYAGTWETAADSLFLRGAYFRPDGEARAAYAVMGDSVLVLRQGDAASQEWRRI